MEEKILQKWQDHVKSFAGVFGKNLIQAAIYRPTTPNGNLVLVLQQDDPQTELRAAPIIRDVLKDKLPTPLIVSKPYIETSLDSFPLEFLNISSHYQNLLCETDLFAELRFDKADVRLQMEREVKGKWVLIRAALLENYGDKKVLNQLISATVGSLVPILKGLLLLLDQKIPQQISDIFETADQYTKIQLDTFALAYQVFAGKRTLQKDELDSFFVKFLQQYNQFMTFIDTFTAAK